MIEARRRQGRGQRVEEDRLRRRRRGRRQQAREGAGARHPDPRRGRAARACSAERPTCTQQTETTMRKITKAVFPGGGPRHALPAGDQGEPEGDAADRRQAADPVRGRGGGGRRHHRHDLHHRPQQARDRGPFRQGLRARDRARAAQQDRRCSRSCRAATPPGINCIYIRQTEALGLGHAVLCAAPVVGDEPFAVLLADDLIDAEVPVMQQMTELATRDGCAVIGVMTVPPGRRRQLRHRRDRPAAAAVRRRSRASSRSRAPARRRRRSPSSAATC